MPRAKLPKGEGKRVPLNMRSTQELRDKIDQAAAASGRSLVQEVEHRLEASFAPAPPSIEEAFGNEETALLGRMIALSAMVVQQKTKKGWQEDEETRRLIFVACRKMLSLSLLSVDEDPKYTDDAANDARAIANGLALYFASPGIGERFPEGTPMRAVRDLVNWEREFPDLHGKTAP